MASCKLVTLKITYNLTALANYNLPLANAFLASPAFWLQMMPIVH